MEKLYWANFIGLIFSPPYLWCGYTVNTSNYILKNVLSHLCHSLNFHNTFYKGNIYHRTVVLKSITMYRGYYCSGLSVDSLSYKSPLIVYWLGLIAFSVYSCVLFMSFKGAL